MIVWFSWIISICEIYGEYRTAGHLVFSKPWPAVELKKVLSVTKHGFVFWAQRKPNTRLEIYKAFQDRLTFLNRHMIVWFSWICSICEIYWKDRTAGHLVFWKPWPVTGHIYSHSELLIKPCGTNMCFWSWFLDRLLKLVQSHNVLLSKNLEEVNPRRLNITEPWVQRGDVSPHKY